MSSWQVEPELLASKPRRIANTTVVWIIFGVIVSMLSLYMGASYKNALIFLCLGAFGTWLLFRLTSRRFRRLISVGDPVAGHIISTEYLAGIISFTVTFEYQGKPLQTEGSMGARWPTNKGYMVNLKEGDI